MRQHVSVSEGRREGGREGEEKRRRRREKYKCQKLFRWDGRGGWAGRKRNPQNEQNQWEGEGGSGRGMQKEIKKINERCKV